MNGAIVGGTIIGGTIIGAIVIHMNIFRNYHYVCKKCSNTYKPESFVQSLFAMNWGKQRRLKCPYCNKKEWANTVKD